MRPQAPIAAPARYSRYAGRAAAFLALTTGLTAHAASLQARSPYVSGEGAAVPIWLYPGAGDAVASMQFQLRYDTRQFTLSGIAAGPAASQAGKDVVFAEHSGAATVIIAGLNQQVLEGGLVATAYLTPRGDSQVPGDIGVASPIFSDPLGKAITVDASPPEDDAPDKNTDNPDTDTGNDGGEETPPPVSTPTPTDDGGNDAADDERRYYGDPHLGNGGGRAQGGVSDATDGANESGGPAGSSDVHSGANSGTAPAASGSDLGESIRPMLPDVPGSVPGASRPDLPLPPLHGGRASSPWRVANGAAPGADTQASAGQALDSTQQPRTRLASGLGNMPRATDSPPDENVPGTLRADALQRSVANGSAPGNGAGMLLLSGALGAGLALACGGIFLKLRRRAAPR